MPAQQQRPSGITLRAAALTAGFAYLFNPVTFAELYAMPRLTGASSAQTLENIMAHPHLFAAAILSYLFSLVGDVVLAWSLYMLLAPVNRALSLLAAWLQLVYAAVSLTAVGQLGVAYRLAIIPDYAGVFPKAELAGQVRLLLVSFRSGWLIALVLFGLHLIVLGWLIAKSTYLPRWLGWLLLVDGVAWVVDSISLYVYPTAQLGFLNIIFAAEMVFMVWLLVRGWTLRETAWESTAVHPLPIAVE